MQKINGVLSSVSPSSSDTESLHAPSAADSPAISLVNPSFPSPASTYAEPQRDGECIHGAHIHDTDAYPEEGRLSVSSNSDEEMVRQHVCDILADSSHDETHEQQPWDASPMQHGNTVDRGSQRGDANPRRGSEDVNTSQLGIDMSADAEKGWDFANAKQVNGEEEGHGEYCRVCHLSVEKSASSGELIKLGCACKDDLAVAHRHCAEAWFKIKGNRTCEICGSIAQNISGSGNANFIEQWNAGEANNPVPRRSERCWQNQPICNTVLVCVILVLIASWLFRVTLF